MSNKRRIPETLGQSEQFVKDSRVLATSELAEKYNRAPRTIREWKAKLRATGIETGYGLVPISKTPVYEAQVIRAEGDFLVLGDLEIPDHDAEILDLAISLGKHLGIKQVVFNGDVVSGDGFGTHKPIMPALRQQGREVEALKQIMHAFGETFDNIYAISGNHDKRVMWGTDCEYTFPDLMKSECGISGVSYFSRMYLKSGDTEWVVGHPDSYRKAPGSGPREAAEIEHMNSVMAHSHHLAEVRDKSGKFVCIEGGHCRDVTKTLYKTASMAYYPKWVSGFVVISNGHHHLFDKERTNWDFWLSKGVADAWKDTNVSK